MATGIIANGTAPGGASVTYTYTPASIAKLHFVISAYTSSTIYINGVLSFSGPAAANYPAPYSFDIYCSAGVAVTFYFNSNMNYLVSALEEY